MNSFELRQQKRKEKARASRRAHEFSNLLEAVGVQSFFEDAFIQFYGLKPKLVYKTGWFYLQGKRISKADLMQQARVLYAKSQGR